MVNYYPAYNCDCRQQYPFTMQTLPVNSPSRELRCQQVLDNISEVIFQLDLEGRCELLNAAWSRLTGFSPEEAFGQPLLAFVHPTDQARIADALQHLQNHHIPALRCETRVITQNAGVNWVRIQARWVDRSSTAQPPVIVGSITDLTPEKLTEAMLRESETRFRQLAENVDTAFFISSGAVDQFFYVSPAFERLWAIPAATLYEHPQLFLTATHPDEQAMVNRAITAAVETLTPLDIEYRVVTSTGGQRWVRLRAWLMQEHDQRAPRMAGTVDDITVRKQHESELLRSNADLAQVAKLKDDFLANMSHELRTPLNQILGLGEVLQSGVYGPLTPSQHTALADLESSGRHLLALINDVLDLSKIEAGQLSLELGSVNLPAVCEASLQFVRQEASQKQIEVERAFDPDVTLVMADERRIKQILVNLLSNAVKFTPMYGRIGLHVMGDREARQLVITVWDTGIGIAPSDQQRLFQPFVQIDSRLARQHAGTGLGLVMVHRLVDLHGGTIALNSVSGEGSRFTVTLPWHPVSPERQPAQTLPGRPAIMPPISLPEDGYSAALVVSANREVSSALSGALAELGIEPILHAHADGVIGISLLTGPSIILVDVEMNRQAVPSIIEQLSRDPRVSSIPVMLLAIGYDIAPGESSVPVARIAPPLSSARLHALLQPILGSSSPVDRDPI